MDENGNCQAFCQAKTWESCLQPIERTNNKALMIFQLMIPFQESFFLQPIDDFEAHFDILKLWNHHPINQKQL